jgi:head-tail adaptor
VIRTNLPERITVLTAPTTGSDSHGNPVQDWAHPVTAGERAFVAPLSTSELVAGQDVVITRYRIVLHPKTSATSASRIVWRGGTFELDGDVQPVAALTGALDHAEAMLRRVSS